MPKKNMENENKQIEEDFYKSIIKNPKFIFCINVARWGLLIVAVIFMIYIVKEIEYIKVLGGDACAYCMQKTGAVCSYSGIENIVGNKTITINQTNIDIFTNALK